MSSEPAAASPDVAAKRQRLVAYLRKRLDAAGEPLYVKSRFIAEDLDLSAKEIGACMKALAERETGPTVEAWGYTNGTTWYVSGESVQ